MNLYLLIGILLIIIVVIDLFRGETNTIGLSSFTGSRLVEFIADLFDIKKESMAELYWVIVVIQLAVGIGFIVYGLNYG